MMTPRRHQVLLAGVNDDVARRLVLKLDAFGVDFQRVPWGRASSRIATRNEFDVIVIGCEPGKPAIEQMLCDVRSPTSRSRTAGVVVIGSGSRLEHARKLLGREVDRIQSLDCPDESWRDAVLDLFHGARRFPLRTSVDLTADLGFAPVTARCRTENVSISGMLLHCPRWIPIGTSLSFSLEVASDQEPIRGEARVARAANREREGLEGIGAAFVSFIEAGGSRLRNALARHRG
jgi:hypothetical protein